MFRPLALAMLLTTPMLPAATAGERFALVVGNDAYLGAPDGAFATAPAPLLSCVNDARAFRSWLFTVGYEPEDIAHLENADRAGFVAATKRLLSQVRRENERSGRRVKQVFFFYSGHGGQVADQDGDEALLRPGDLEDEVFVMTDFPSRDRLDSAEDVERYIVRDDDFFAWLSALSRLSEKIVVVIDSCHAGGLSKDLRAKGPPAKWFPIPREFGGRETDPALAREAGLGLITKSIAKDLVERVGELKEFDRGAEFVFLAAVDELQVAAAGESPESLSLYTEELLTALSGGAPVADRDCVSPLTLAALQEHLLARAHPTRTPVALSTDRQVKILPGIFELSPSAQAADVLQRVLTAPTVAHDKTCRLAMEVDSPGPYRIGELVQFTVTSSRAGHLVVFHASPSGEVQFFFPNGKQPSSRVDAGTVKRFATRAAPPAGRDHLFAYLFAEDPFRGFDFSRFEFALPAGNLREIIRRYPQVRDQLTSDDLPRSLVKGMAIELPQGPKRTGADATWTRAQLLLETRE